MLLEDKVALITGGNSGIGLATAKRFVREGARVIITGRRPDAVAEAAEEIGNGVVGLVGDAGKLEEIEKVLEEAQDHHDHLDVLFLNAGIAPSAMVGNQSEEVFDQLFEVNVKGPYFTVQKALPLLSEGASIIFNGSGLIFRGVPGMSAYSASKAALRSLARSLAAELAPQGIRVNLLSPGPIATPLWQKGDHNDPERAEQTKQMIPLGRFGQPEEIAATAAFLASADSSFVTGAHIAADGGFGQV